jgi:hypothetical protein
VVVDDIVFQSDLASEGFLGNVNQLDDYCRDKKFHAWFETSAKENLGIDEAARCLVAKVMMFSLSSSHLTLPLSLFCLPLFLLSSCPKVCYE